MKTIICPYCFEKISAADLIFVCEKCGSDLGKRMANKSMRCNHCSLNTTSLKCPECKEILPQSVDELSDVIIAIIGAKESGKSHYIAVLVEQIKKLYKQFGWNLVALTTDTTRRYRAEFYDPLFKDHRTIDATQEGIRKPLLYSLRFRKKFGLFNRRIMLAFFDTAGEELDRMIHEMDNINRYIYNASGIICLLDPLQLDSVRQELEPRIGKKALPQKNTDTETVLTNVRSLIQHGFKSQGRSFGNSKIPIPLALAFSKIDVLKTDDPNASPVLFDKTSSPIFQPTRHNGVFSQEQFKNIHDYLDTWLHEVDTSQSIIQPCLEFEKVGFFACSALGHNPQETQTLKQDPAPLRVEDPFLWILRQKGLIKGERKPLNLHLNIDLSWLKRQK